jgi:hypothetical protein
MAASLDSLTGPDAHYNFPGGLDEWGAVTEITADCNLYRTVVTHPRKWRWFTKSRRGTDTSSRAKSGNCFIDGFYGWLKLDCWAGNYAAASYRFGLPDDARRITRSIRGTIGCCNNGTVTKRWQGNTGYVVVTGWRAYTIKRVRVEYQHRVRVRKVTTYNDTGHGDWLAP